MNDPRTKVKRTILHGNSAVLKRALWTAVLAAAFFVAPSARSQSNGSSSPDAVVLEPAVRMMLGPTRTVSQFNYVMTGRIRLLFFWKGADDVGGGYIRRSVSLSDPAFRFIEVLFGSDPVKAPRRINNWGAATEAIGDRSSAFFGFMKSANSDSADAAQADIRSQNEHGKYAFSASVGFVDPFRALSRSAPLFSNVDFDLHQLERAQKLVAGHLAEDRPVRRLDPPERLCPAARGFLQAVEDLAGRALAARPVPSSLCYLHNARNYTVTLERRTPVHSKKIQLQRKNGTALEATYRNLVRAEFSVVNHKLERSSFELFLATDGEISGMPVQIVHQPNWWFQVVLNLDNKQR